VRFISTQSWFQSNPAQVPLRITVTILVSIFLILGYGFLLICIFYFASQRDWRLSILISNPPSLAEIRAILTLNETVLLNLAHRLIFLERMVYWFTGWHVFNDHPWLGVGLGNAGFFALLKTPSIGWASYEIRELLFRLPQLPNIKSFWVRLFAETGLIGFSMFSSWLVLLFRSAQITLGSHKAVLRVLAFSGQLSLIAFIGEGFSIDSFAMPYLWIATGLIAAVGWVYRKGLVLELDT
jgi:hypothetical protein